MMITYKRTEGGEKYRQRHFSAVKVSNRTSLLTTFMGDADIHISNAIYRAGHAGSNHYNNELYLEKQDSI